MKNSKLIETSNTKADDPYLLIKWYWANYFKKYWLLLILGIIFMGLEGSMFGCQCCDLWASRREASRS